MATTEKYQGLIDMAQQGGVENLDAREENNVLYLSGTAPTSELKQQLWDEYGRLDPDMRAGDLILNIDVAGDTGQYYTIERGDTLSEIAARHDGITWQQIYEANRDVIKDPDKIYPGQKIRIPSEG